MWFWETHSIQIDCKTSKVIPLQNLQTAASVLDVSYVQYHIEYKTNQLFSLDWSWQDSLEIQGERIKFFSSANRLGKTRTKSALPVSCSVWNKILLIIHLIQLHSSLLFVALYRAEYAILNSTVQVLSPSQHSWTAGHSKLLARNKIVGRLVLGKRGWKLENQFEMASRVKKKKERVPNFEDHSSTFASPIPGPDRLEKEI